MLKMLEPQNRARNKNVEALFKNPCSYKIKSVYGSFETLMLGVVINSAHSFT